MPELDYVVLADYVRQDGGTIHIMAAGIDTFTVSQIPVTVPVGVAARIMFTSTEEAGVGHLVQLVFQGPDGPLLDLRQQIARPPQPPGVPEHWKTSVGLAFRIGLPLPSYGDYSLELIIDEDEGLSKSIDVRVIKPPVAEPQSEPA
jgi:hypothetical protein